MKVYVLVFCVAVVVACSSTTPDNDFDIVCGYFGQLDQASLSKQLTPNERKTFILERLTSGLQTGSPARVALEVIFDAEAAVRYDMYQTSAYEVLGEAWSCAPMEKWLPLTGSG